VETGDTFLSQRQNSSQIAALESEIGKLQKNLENARATYSSLQKQYQEQCSVLLGVWYAYFLV
jgi:septation ring formation regulator EzrA